ncbi:metallophosphoesterase [Bacillus sp. 1P06AnD]|uniref:metallophosphoesterase n=1 Tax=Bacillus sp. 1P06AnD TaxID=3132208 RepID=UPI00399F04B9
MLDIQELKLPAEGRVIAISDIHGDLPLLKRLLAKVTFTEDDMLILNGDLCEKGPDSLSVVRFAMELMAENQNVHITQGNCDGLVKYVFEGDEDILQYMKKRPFTILNECLAEQGRTIADFKSMEDLQAFYRPYYGKEFDWLLNLPVALETEDFLFIHAGIENRTDWRNTSFESAVSIPDFYNKGHQSEKIVVVGHWPVVNYRAETLSHHNPRIDLEKRIIAIDGGNRLKVDGQLNAFIITCHPGKTVYSYTYVDSLERSAVVKKKHELKQIALGTVTYPNYEMRKLREGTYFTLCENVKLGIEQLIKNEYLKEKEGVLHANDDTSTTLLPVDGGEAVAIVDDQCTGYMLVKKEGAVGWVPKSCFE